jgi:hypothetical protein
MNGWRISTDIEDMRLEKCREVLESILLCRVLDMTAKGTGLGHAKEQRGAERRGGEKGGSG